MIELRPPKPSEIRDIEKLWVNSFCPRSLQEEHGGAKYVRVGYFSGRGVARHVWMQAHREYVTRRLERDLLIVADYGGDLAGFVSFSPPGDGRSDTTLHYLYVLNSGRRRGIGSRLYKAVRKHGGDAPIRTTHTTRLWSEFAMSIQ